MQEKANFLFLLFVWFGVSLGSYEDGQLKEGEKYTEIYFASKGYTVYRLPWGTSIKALTQSSASLVLGEALWLLNHVPCTGRENCRYEEGQQFILTVAQDELGFKILSMDQIPEKTYGNIYSQNFFPFMNPSGPLVFLTLSPEGTKLLEWNLNTGLVDAAYPMGENYLHGVPRGALEVNTNNNAYLLDTFVGCIRKVNVVSMDQVNCLLLGRLFHTLNDWTTFVLVEGSGRYPNRLLILGQIDEHHQWGIFQMNTETGTVRNPNITIPLFGNFQLHMLLSPSKDELFILAQKPLDWLPSYAPMETLLFRYRIPSEKGLIVFRDKMNLTMSAYTSHFFQDSRGYLYLTSNAGELVRIKYQNTSLGFWDKMTIMVRPSDTTDYNPDIMPHIIASLPSVDQFNAYLTCSFSGYIIKVDLDSFCPDSEMCQIKGLSTKVLLYGGAASGAFGMLLCSSVYFIVRKKKQEQTVVRAYGTWI